MRRGAGVLLLVAASAVVSVVEAAELPPDGEVIPLWPGAAPGSSALAFDEVVTERSSNPDVRKDRSIRKVLSPSLTVFRPASPNGAAILVLPGGGYVNLAWDKEGVEIARWLNGLGVTAFVLKYRSPADGHENRLWVPLQDAQRAVRLVRHRGEGWGLDPSRLGVLGFSAGGHLTSMVAVHHDRRVYEPVDAADAGSARPDFVILGYPVISMRPRLVHTGSLEALTAGALTAIQLEEFSTETRVTARTPPAFLFHAGDDKAVPADNSILFYQALRGAGVPAELHVFDSGGHGFGQRVTSGPASTWPALCAEWLEARGVLASRPTP